MTPSRPLHPGTALEISLIATVDRHLRTAIPRADSIAELRQLGAERSDMLALAAGSYLGTFLARTRAEHHAAECVARLIAAGADPAQTVLVGDEVRANLRSAGYQLHDRLGNQVDRD